MEKERKNRIYITVTSVIFSLSVISNLFFTAAFIDMCIQRTTVVGALAFAIFYAIFIFSGGIISAVSIVLSAAGIKYFKYKKTFIAMIITAFLMALLNFMFLPIFNAVPPAEAPAAFIIVCTL